jgi:hypothetical protein
MALATLTQAATATQAAKARGVYVNTALSDTPADFDALTAATVTVDGSMTGFSNDGSWELYITIWDSTGVTAYASQVQVQSRSSNGSFTTSAIGLTITAAGLAASKANWDASLIGMMQDATGVSMGADSVVYETTTTTKLDITYDVAVTPTFLAAWAKNSNGIIQ